ncbi:hypothetical protein [Ferruginibacter sp. HRS2-29]|uniref:hypothetical protein n=1 Tax=Ferruginibacter sp. HRS2-29 TaxID=2487334 RepID=UPI0020CE0EA2|nr:hypothetical protein [Ferruginibacter sp. HRS2-29]
MGQLQKILMNAAENISQILVDTSTKEKIRKHLSDVNDVITEEDIKNIRTDIFITKPAYSINQVGK